MKLSEMSNRSAGIIGEIGLEMKKFETICGHCGGQDKEARLRWFGNVKSRCINVPMRSCERLSMVGLRRG